MSNNTPYPEITVSSHDPPSRHNTNIALSEKLLRFTYDDDGLVPIQDSGMESLGDLLRTYAIERTEDQLYWTEKLLHHILTRDRVQRELKKPEYNWTSPDIHKFVDLICEEAQSIGGFEPVSYIKIFALLVLLDRIRDFPNFVKNRCCDQRLPVKILREKGRPVFCSDREKHPENIKCFDGWPDRDKDGFRDTQWSFTAPFFHLMDDRICKKFDLHPSTVKPWRMLEESTGGPDKVGAYGIVQMFEFHPTSHSFDRVLARINLGQKFAIKTLHNETLNYEQQCSQEFEQLKRFSGFIHPHLVTTLGAFQQGKQWSLIFPSAHCNLDEFLERGEHAVPWGQKAVSWASQQLCGMMEALYRIHEPTHLHVGQEAKKYGRHGDIKCDNILCFRTRGDSEQFLLVISDFGLSALNRDKSRSNIPNKAVPPTPGYRPPECDIKGGVISRKYDIWTMGCLFLEFVTWLLGGPGLLEEFRKERETVFYNGSKNDVFFTFERVDKPDTFVIRVKVEVTRWIQRLRANRNCSHFIHDVLNLIEGKMLVVLEKGHQGQRASSGTLKKALESMQLKYEKDSSYGTRGDPKEYQEPLPAPAVLVTPSEHAENIIAQKEPPLPLFRGEKRLSMQPDQFEDLTRQERQDVLI